MTAMIRGRRWPQDRRSTSLAGPGIPRRDRCDRPLLPVATRGPYTLGIVSRLTSSFEERGNFAMSDPASLHETNPLRQALPRTQVPDPCAVVLFGATGDLAHRKLVPALFQLARGATCPRKCAVVGFARRDWTDQNLRDEYAKSLAKDDKDPDFGAVWAQFASRLFFASGTFDDPAGYRRLEGDPRRARPDPRDAG